MVYSVRTDRPIISTKPLKSKRGEEKGKKGKLLVGKKIFLIKRVTYIQMLNF